MSTDTETRTEKVAGRRVAIVANTSFFVGPPLARELAASGCNLVLGDPRPGLVEELAELGAETRVVAGVKDLADPHAAPRLLEMALDAFGRIDAAVFFSGPFVSGSFLDSAPEQLQQVVRGNLEAPYRALRTFLPPMVEAGSGQVLVITSTAGLKVTPGMPLYSATRAGANMLVKNVAVEVAPHGVQVNAVGTNNMDFSGFLRTSGAADPKVRKQVEQTVPLRRLGRLEEFARFCSIFLDGSSGFQTGQVVAYDGGWSVE